MPMNKFMEKLWGDWYYDKAGGKWTNSKNDFFTFLPREKPTTPSIE